MSIWSHPFFLEFIQIYKSEECLWDQQSDHYFNRSRKLRAYERLRKKLSEIDERATQRTVQKKINNLRTVFLREHRKVQRSLNTDNVFVPKLWYYKHLEFLADHVAPLEGPRQRAVLPSSKTRSTSRSRESDIHLEDAKVEMKPLVHTLSLTSEASSFEGEDEQRIDDVSGESQVCLDQDLEESHADSTGGLSLEVFNEELDNDNNDVLRSPMTSTKPALSSPTVPKSLKSRWKKRKESQQSQLGDTVLNLVRKHFPRSEPQQGTALLQEDYFDVAGMNLSGKLKLLPRYQRIFAEKLISDILFHAEFGQLSTSSRVDIGNIAEHGPSHSQSQTSEDS